MAAETTYWDFYFRRTKKLAGGGEYPDTRQGYRQAQEDCKSLGFEKTAAVRDSNGKVISKERIDKVPMTMRPREKSTDDSGKTIHADKPAKF